MNTYILAFTEKNNFNKLVLAAHGMCGKVANVLSSLYLDHASSLVMLDIAHACCKSTKYVAWSIAFKVTRLLRIIIVLNSSAKTKKDANLKEMDNPELWLFALANSNNK